MAPSATPLSSNGGELSNPPTDGITNLRFSNHSDNLLVSSWDMSVRLYDARENVLRGRFMHDGAVLDCCFHDDSSGFSASLDRKVRRLEFNHDRADILGTHDEPVRCVENHYETGQVITGSWDKTLKCWDPRGAGGQDRCLVGTYAQPERVYSMSLVGKRLVVATAKRHVNVYDIRNMSQPEQQRESSLDCLTRCVRCYPDGKGYALSSRGGRVAIEYFDRPEPGQPKKYDILLPMCHRKSVTGTDIVYPVNTIAFHPIYGTFATGGCDGIVNAWDRNRKARICQYAKYPTSIAALSFSKDGSLLAVASSYTFEEGPKEHEPDSIFIRVVGDVTFRPK